MPDKRSTLAVSLAALISVAALLAALAPEAGAAPRASPARSAPAAAPHNPPVLPLPEQLIGEGVTIEGPLLQNIALPSLTPLL
ncbi:hypothetical protein AB0O01_08025 [Streptomyces sp. NPDC093252]|uniref:hypothetical protein n=1 Tax=Streptomyces sp. NPDC093252 TaxID=3154980 RepID=UPI00343C7A40